MIVILIASLFWIIHEQRKEAPAPSKQVASRLPLIGGEEKELKQSPVTELMKHFTPWRSAVASQAVPDRKPSPRVETKPLPVEALPKLIHDYDAAPKLISQEKTAKPKEPSIPFGSVIACRLLQSVTCGKTAIPVIAELLQPVSDGKGGAWIPAGIRIHGSLRSGNLPGRLDSGSGWIFVLPQQKLLEAKASLQDRDFDPNLKVYGVNDGTAGIAGTLMKASDWKSRTVRDALTVAADATQDRARTALGEVELGSARNALLRGVSSLVNGAVPKEEASPETIVSVEAGKEFYLYIEDKGEPNSAPGAGEVEAMLRERGRLMEQIRQQTGKERP